MHLSPGHASRCDQSWKPIPSQRAQRVEPSPRLRHPSPFAKPKGEGNSSFVYLLVLVPLKLSFGILISSTEDGMVHSILPTGDLR
jgi:hypothetical protein